MGQAVSLPQSAALRSTRALVVGVHANVRRGLSQSRHALSHKTTMQAVARVLDLEKGEEVPCSRIISSFSGQAVAMPSAVAFLPSGKHFIDVYSVSHDFKLIVYNERGGVAERTLFELPAGPTGLALTRDGRTVFFNCRWARSIAQVTIADIRRPNLAHKVQITQEPWDELRAFGAHVFHNSRDTRMTPNRWLACGCCHLDGGNLSDNLVWEFTENQKPSSPRLVNTKPLSITGWSAPQFLFRARTARYKRKRSSSAPSSEEAASCEKKELRYLQNWQGSHANLTVWRRLSSDSNHGSALTWMGHFLAWRSSTPYDVVDVCSQVRALVAIAAIEVQT